jgi:hypothetical protein
MQYQTLTRERHTLLICNIRRWTRERVGLTRERVTLTRERVTLTRERVGLTRERVTLTRECRACVT